MLTTHVALVPLEPQNATFNRRLLLVAAALQTQVVRDFAPIWGTSAVVSPFLRLDDVPPEYFPLIVSRTPLPGDHDGLHLATGGRPFALVHTDGDWSVAASHELLEMVLDPDGARSVSGLSIADRSAAAGSPPSPDYRRQGTVDYFRELCDPVETCTYEINGVKVSDFVTPAYYDDLDAPSNDREPGRVYSFLGSVTEPFQILTTGYLSWRTREPRNSVWQACGPDMGKDGSGDACTPARLDQLVIHELTDPPAASPDGGTSRASRGGTAYPPWPPIEQAFQSDVQEVVGLLSLAPPPPTLRDLIRLFEAIHGGEEPTDALFTKYHVKASAADRAAFKGREKRANLQKILELLRQQERIASLLGAGVPDPGLPWWVCYLMP